MNYILTLSRLITLSTLCSSRFVHMESSRSHDSIVANHFDLTKRAPGDTVHEVVFAVRQRNFDELQKKLFDISNPESKNFRKYLTRDEISLISSNLNSTIVVLEHLKNAGLSVISQSLYGEYIRVSGNVSILEETLSTKFFEYTHKKSRLSTIRTSRYSLPEHLVPHVISVFNTVQFPMISMARYPKTMKQIDESVIHYITPSKLKSKYNIPESPSDVLSSHSVFEACEQSYAKSDLHKFFEQNQISSKASIHEIGAYGNSESRCREDMNNCGEANLDMQYIMAISPNSPVTYWYADDFIPWIEDVASTTNPPSVHSISYGIDEIYISDSMVATFDNECVKLGLMGVTVVAASGDDGANSRDVRQYGSSACGYVPTWPASSPYVLAVGATQGVESDTTEVACESAHGGITSGGGFSTIYAAPSFQKDAIRSYFDKAKGSHQPKTGYESLGRGYPDVSMSGAWYDVIIAGSRIAVSGTSAATPVIAGMISLINAQRLASGLTTVGWINPLLYSSAGSFANDITAGNNKCSGDVNKCCQEGFYTTTGWDPVTGFGSVDFAKFANLLHPLDMGVGR